MNANLTDNSAPIELAVKDRIKVKLKNARGHMDQYSSDFLVGSLANFAADMGDDVDATLAEAEAKGKDLYWLISEGITIAAHVLPKDRLPRQEVPLGAIVKIEGNFFKVVQVPNYNLKLQAI